MIQPIKVAVFTAVSFKNYITRSIKKSVKSTVPLLFPPLSISIPDLISENKRLWPGPQNTPRLLMSAKNRVRNIQDTIIYTLFTFFLLICIVITLCFKKFKTKGKI